MLESQYKQAEGTSFFGKISKMLGGGSEGPVLGYSDEQIMREAIYNDFKRIIASFMHCWNDLPIFSVRNFNFARSGIFPYSSEDDKLYEKQLLHFSILSDQSRQSAMNASRDTMVSSMTQQVP